MKPLHNRKKLEISQQIAESGARVGSFGSAQIKGDRRPRDHPRKLFSPRRDPL